MASAPIAKLGEIRDQLNRAFLERAELIDGALAALLSHNHVLLIGPVTSVAATLCRRWVN